MGELLATSRGIPVEKPVVYIGEIPTSVKYYNNVFMLRLKTHYEEIWRGVPKV